MIAAIFFISGIIVNIQLILFLRYAIPLIKEKFEKDDSNNPES